LASTVSPALPLTASPAAEHHWLKGFSLAALIEDAIAYFHAADRVYRSGEYRMTPSPGRQGAPVVAAPARR